MTRLPDTNPEINTMWQHIPETDKTKKYARPQKSSKSHINKNTVKLKIK